MATETESAAGAPVPVSVRLCPARYFARSPSYLRVAAGTCGVGPARCRRPGPVRWCAPGDR